MGDNTASSDEYINIDVTHYGGHEDEVNCVAFSTDFEILVTGADDSVVRVFNALCGKFLIALEGHTAPVRTVAMSRNSRFIASGSQDKTVRVWRTRDGAALHEFTGHSKSVECLCFCPESRLLCSGSWDRSAIQWSLEVTGSWDSTARLYDRKQDHACAELTQHTGSVLTTAFSRESLLATGSSDHTILLWRPLTAEVLRVLRGHLGGVRCLAFSQDSLTLVSAGHADKVLLWDVVEGECITQLQERTAEVHLCGFDPGGAVVAAGSVGMVMALL